MTLDKKWVNMEKENYDLSLFHNIPLYQFLLAFIFLTLHTIYVLMIMPDVAYMDTLRYITNYVDIKDNFFHVLKYWNQGQHRGLISQFVLWSNIYFFGMNILLANILTGFILLLIASVICLRAVRVGGWGWVGCLFSVMVYFMVFSPAAFELFTLDLGFPEIARNLFILMTYYEIDRYISGRDGKGWLFISFQLVFLIVFWAYGRSYAYFASLLIVAIISIFVRGWGVGRRAASFAMTGALAILAYIMGGIFLPGPIQGYGTHDFGDALFKILLLPYSMALGVIGGETAMSLRLPKELIWVIGLTYIVFVAGVLKMYIKKIRNVGSFVPIYMIFYGLFSGLAVCFARGADYMSVMASRYFPDVLIFFVGFFWMLYDMAWDKSSMAEWVRGVGRKKHASLCLLIFIIILGQGLTWGREYFMAKYRYDVFRKMREVAVSCNSLDQKAAQLLQATSLEVARKAVFIEQSYRLGQFNSIDVSRRCNLQ